VVVAGVWLRMLGWDSCGGRCRAVGGAKLRRDLEVSVLGTITLDDGMKFLLTGIFFFVTFLFYTGSIDIFF